MINPEIDEILVGLDVTIEDARRTKSKIGFFAAGEFEDGPRMDRFDAIFAKRYIGAVHAWQTKGQPTRSWKMSSKPPNNANVDWSCSTCYLA